MSLGRNDKNKIMKMELHDVKFIFTMCGRNWNRSHYPFIVYYYQRRDSIKLHHQCDAMTDDDIMMCHKNSADEWEHELSINADCSIDNHRDWCAENNFGANNFGFSPTVMLESKIRHDVGLHVPSPVI